MPAPLWHLISTNFLQVVQKVNFFSAICDKLEYYFVKKNIKKAPYPISTFFGAYKMQI